MDTPTLIVIRGLPGSGKSHYLYRLPDNIIKIDAETQAVGPGDLYSKVSRAFDQGNIVAVAGLFRSRLSISRLFEHVQSKVCLTIQLIIIEPPTPWARDPVECCRKTIERGERPQSVKDIAEILKTWEDYEDNR